MAPIASLIIRGSISTATDTINAGTGALGSCDSTGCAVGISVAVVVILLLIIGAAYAKHRSMSAEDQKAAEKLASESKTSTSQTTLPTDSRKIVYPIVKTTMPSENRGGQSRRTTYPL